MSDKPTIVFDSNVLSAFIDATDGQDLALSTDPQRWEWIATFWLFQFCDASVVSTVTEEAEAIPNQARQTAHLNAVGVQFHEINPHDDEMPTLRRRAEELARIHADKNGFNDCLILAIAEAAKIPIVVTLDRRFRTKLGSSTDLQLLTPVDACRSVGIPDSAKPH